MRVTQLRDLSVWNDGNGQIYVTASDANAGVGSRPDDFLQCPPEDPGYSAAKVALMEVCAAGAEPLLVMNTLCLKYDDYGSRVVDGIRKALAEAGSTAPVSGSDETNMTTLQTGVGVTVIGVVPSSRLRLGTSRPGDVVLCAGYPRSGLSDAPYTEGDADVAALSDVIDVLRCAAVHEVLPVGSKGVRTEVAQLAATAGLAFVLEPEPAVPMDVSAGASTCFLITCGPADLPVVATATRLPLVPVATLVCEPVA